MIDKLGERINLALEAVKTIRDKLRDGTLSEEEKRKNFHTAINNLFAAHHSINRLSEFFKSIKMHLEDLEQE